MGGAEVHSSVCVHDERGWRPGRSSDAYQPHCSQARAIRGREHVDPYPIWFLFRGVPTLAGYLVRGDVGTDYRYRIIIPKTVWKEVASMIAEELSYSNFKNEAARSLGDKERGYVHALTTCGA